MSLKRDKELVRKRFEAGFSRYDKLAVVQQQISSELAAMIDTTPHRILEIGAGTGFLTRELTERFPDTEWVVNDLSPYAKSFLDKHLDGKNHSYVWGDAEVIDFPVEVDLIASSSTVQWFENLPEFAAKCYKSLRKNGVLAMSTFGTENFRQLRTATGEGLDYHSITELKELLHDAGFSAVEACESIKDVTFDSPTDALRHVKATGVNSLRQERWNRAKLAQFDEKYRAICPSEIRLTYHPILIIARK